MRPPGITAPEIIAAGSAHAAIDKACDMLKIKLVRVPIVEGSCEMDAAATGEDTPHTHHTTHTHHTHQDTAFTLCVPPLLWLRHCLDPQRPPSRRTPS